jgi:hypothetical protein
MSLRVNLLRESELRYQGPISLRFAVTVVGLAFGFLLLLTLTFAVYRQIAVSRDLKWCNAEWQKMEEHFKEIQKKEQDLASDQGLLKELDGWSEVRIEWRGVLESLQTVVPANVQLTRINMRGDWDFVKQPAPAAAATPLSEDGQPIRPKELPAIPTRLFKMDIGGRASGQLADEDVVRFANAIKTQEELRKLFESVKLQHLTREQQAGAGEDADRVFEIEGVFTPRKMP